MRKIFKIIIAFFILIIIVLLMYMFLSSKNQKKENILFLGDSITERYKLDKYLFYYNTINSGVGGNTTNDILKNMETRVNKYNFNKVFLLVGINDLLFTEENDEEIIKNIEKIMDNINNKNSKIYLESIYPINTNITKDIDKSANERINKFNKKLEKICNTDKCTYINVHDKLLDKEGNLKKIYTNDGIHINKLGYVIVTKRLLKYINE